MHLVVENKCVTSTCIYHSPRLCGHSVGLVCNYDSRVVYSLFFIPPKNLGDPGSSRGTLEHIRVDLTIYIDTVLYAFRSKNRPKNANVHCTMVQNQTVLRTVWQTVFSADLRLCIINLCCVLFAFSFITTDICIHAEVGHKSSRAKCQLRSPEIN